MTAGIVEFLTARLDEDERIARAASDGPWKVNDVEYAESIQAGNGFTDVVAGGRWGGEAGVFDSTEDAIHIARHDPTRVLAEVAAKRAILAEHLPGTDRRDEHDAMMRTVPCPTLIALVQPYAEHPHFHPSWATERV